MRRWAVQLVRLLVVGLFATLALQNLGVELVPLIGGLGVAGAAVALALQGVFSNVAAGLTIIFTRPFRIGDYIGVVGEDGQVANITLFDTVLKSADRSTVVIPNRRIVGEILHSYGAIRQLDLAIAVAYGADLKHALATLDALLRGEPRVLRDPAPVIGVKLLDQFAVRIAVKPWVAIGDYVALVGALNQAMIETFNGQGLSVPVPRQDVQLLAASDLALAR